MKNLKKVLASLLLVCMVCSMLAVPAVADGSGEIEVKLNRYGLPMAVNEVYDLTGSVEPDNLGNINLLWSSSDEAVAAVDANGVVTALALGTAEITASTTDGLYSTVCQVVVADPVVPVEGISLDKSEFSMDVGSFANLLPTVYPENASVQRVMWLSSDENVLTVDENGNITALAEGTVTVTAFAAELDLSAETLNEALMAKCQIYVIDRVAEAERIAAEQAAAEAERIAAEQAAAEAERIAAEQAAAEAERIAAEQAAAEAERIAAEQAAAEAERIAAEQAAAEAERIAAEQAAAEAERIAAEQAAAEAERIAAEQAAAEEAARKAAEQAAAEEAARKAAEQAAAEEAARKAAAENTLVLPTVGLNATLDATMAFASNPFATSTLELDPDPSLVDASDLPNINVGPYGSNLSFSTVEISATPTTEIYAVLSDTSITSDIPYTWEITGANDIINLSTVEGYGSERRGITVLKEGETTIDLSREGVANPTTITVKVYPEFVKITDDAAGTEVPNGSVITIDAGTSRKFSADSYGKDIEWSGSTSTISVDQTGLVTVSSDAANGDTATITATSKNDAASPKASSSFTVTVNKPGPMVVPVSSVTISPNTLSILPGHNSYTTPFTVTVEPADATDKTVSWSGSANGINVDKNGVISVDANATVGASTTIYATSNYDNTKSASCVVTVADPALHVTGVTLDKSSYTLTLGSATEVTLYATVTPNNATNRNVSWTSDNESVATVTQDGKVTAVSAGTANITVTTEDGSKTASCAVTVRAQPEVQIYCEYGDSLTFYNNEGSYSGLSASIKDNAITPTNFTWSSSNEDIVAVAGTGANNAMCVVTIKGNVGSAVITASHDGCTVDTVSVNVIAPTNVPVTGITLTADSSSVPVGGTLQITANITPADASNKALIWSSGDTSIATVDQTGKVTGVKEGSVYIYADAQDGSGKRGQGVVTVTAPVKDNLYVSASTNKITSAGGTAMLTARLADNSIVPNASISWTVSPADMATVSANGVVTPKRTGTFTVTGNFSANGKIYTGYTTIQMTPVIIYGNNSSYNGSDTPLYFVVNDLSANARSVRVDGYTLTHGQHCYIYDHQGYIAVALNPAYLRTLNPSVVHTIQIDSANGTATGYFRIYGYSSSINGVKTGDENQAALWAALLFVSVVGMGAVLISRRKEWNG